MPLAISLVRGRRDLADHVPAGSRHRRDQRRSSRDRRATFSAEGVLTAGVAVDRRPRPARSSSGFELQQPLEPGDVALLGLTAIRVPEIPEDAVQAVKPEPLQGGITGVVWRDFKPGGGTPGRGRARRSSGSPASPSSCATRAATRSTSATTDDERHLRVRRRRGRRSTRSRSAQHDVRGAVRGRQLARRRS